MVDKCKQSKTTSTTHMKENFQVNTFQDSLKAWMDLYDHCVCQESYLKYAFQSIKRNKTTELGKPHGDQVYLRSLKPLNSMAIYIMLV